MRRACIAAVITASVLIGILFARHPISAQQPACLHGQDEAAAQRDRRMQALRTARQINTLEVNGRNSAGRFQPVGAFVNIVAPEGFTVHFATDGASYAFSVKDTLDPCAFAYFSDEAGLIYAGQALQ